MKSKIGCASCQFNATIILGDRFLCYFCARQVIFDMVRTSHEARFKNGEVVDGMKVITFSTKKEILNAH